MQVRWHRVWPRQKIVRPSRYIYCGRGARWFSLDARYDTPLRILFCGTDEFSTASLRALDRYAKISDGHVDCINVATRTDKRVGRGLKHISSPPIKTLAQELNLRLHQFDTFTGWTPPPDTNFNMVIAVSFGLKVPPRILQACEFGGLNVHPSLLPDLKGASPIESAIIHGYTKTGITVQTLHPTKFDEGRIVAQTSAMMIPQPEHITAAQLRGILAPVGANLLVQALSQRSYLDEVPATKVEDDSGLRTASKLSPAARQVDFANMSARQMSRLNRAVSKLWFMAKQSDEDTQGLRITLGDEVREAQSFDLAGLDEGVLAQIPVGMPFAFAPARQNLSESKASLLVKTVDGSIVVITEITVAGKKRGPSVASLSQAKLWAEIIDLPGVKLCKMRPALWLAS